MYQAICLRMVKALNMIINTMKMSRAVKSQAITDKSAPLSITARSALFAYVRGKTKENQANWSFKKLKHTVELLKRVLAIAIGMAEDLLAHFQNVR